MQKFFLLVVSLFIIGCATQSPDRHLTNGKFTKGQTLTVKTTAYTHSEKGGGRNALGRRLSGSEERSASADWARFPVGTRFKIVQTGDIYRVDDYGSALVRKQTIDLYKPTRTSMRSWGVRYVDIKILEWGSPEKSLEILLPRSRNPHVRAMINDLREEI